MSTHTDTDSGSTAMQQNRNLSGIIETIQDEGPSPSLGSRLPGQDDDVPAGFHAAGGTRVPATGHGLVRWLSFALLVLVVVGGAIGVAWQYLLGPSEEDTVKSAITDDWSALPGRSEQLAASPPAAAVGQAMDATTPLLEIQATQGKIIARLDELSAAMAEDRNRSTARWAENDATVKELREKQRRELDGIAADLAVLQERLGKQSAAAATSPVEPASTPQAAATDPAVVSGEWVVNVVSSSQEKPVKEMMSSLQQQGISVVLQTETVDGNTRYRLQVPGFASSDEARRYAKKLNSEHGLEGAWPSRK